MAKHQQTQLHVGSTVIQLPDKSPMSPVGHMKAMLHSLSKWICSPPFKSKTYPLQKETHHQILYCIEFE